MPLLKNNAFVADTWVSLADDVAQPDGGNVIVSFERLQKEWDLLAKYTGQIGVTLANTVKASDLQPYYAQLGLVVLNFPAYTDGRSYSLARQIRNEGFSGELRATGNLLPDQFQYMHQVGFDAFEVTDRFPLETWQAASRQMSLAYQRGLFRTAGEHEVWTERHLNDDAPPRNTDHPHVK
jgi:uncharacterized protein (DUF934 family)